MNWLIGPLADSCMERNRSKMRVGIHIRSGNGVNCDGLSTGLPDTSSRGCLQFLFGFLSYYGIPGAGQIRNPPSITALYIAPDCELNPNAQPIFASMAVSQIMTE